MLFTLFIFKLAFCLGEVAGQQPQETWYTSQSTAISHSSAGSTPRRDQARSEMQLLHPSLGRPLGRFPVDLARRTCLTSLSGAFWIQGRTNVVVIFQFGEVVLHSGPCEFHSCALCCEVSYQGRNKGGTVSRESNHWVAPKSPNNVASVFFNTVLLLPKDLRFEHGGAKLASWPGCHLTSIHPCVTP